MQALRSSLLGAAALTLTMILAGCGVGSSPKFTGGSGLTPQAAAAPTVVSVGEQVNGDAPNRIQDVQFNEAMNSTTINNQTFLVKDGGGSAVPGVVSYNPQFQVASFKPTPALKVNTDYTLTVTTGVASDEGVHLAQNYTSSFVTRSTMDSSPLYVASVMPQPNATCVSPNTNITITFSEGVDVSLLTPTNISIMGPTGGAIAATMSYNVGNSIVTLTPDSPLPMGKIIVTVKGVGDMADTLIIQPYVFGFYTTCGTSGGGGQASSGNEYLYLTVGTPYNAIYGYQINSSTGKLTPTTGPPFPANIGQSSPTCMEGCEITLLNDPLGRYLFYSWISTPSGVGVLQVNASNGALTQGDVVSQAENFYPSVDPMGRFLYGNNGPIQGLSSSSSLEGFKLNGGGALSATPGSYYSFPGNLSYSAPAVSNDFVYAVAYGGQTPSTIYGFRIDQQTGQLTQTGATPDGTLGIYQAITPSGSYLYSVQAYVNKNNGTFDNEIVGFRVNSDGSLAKLNMPPAQTTDGGGAFLMMSPNGNFLYLGVQSGLRAYAINQNTGALTLTADYTSYTFNMPVIDPAVKYVYMDKTTGYPPSESNQILTFKVNPVTGALTPIPADTLTLTQPGSPGAFAIVRAQ